MYRHLKKRAEFLNVAASGQKWISHHLVIQKSQQHKHETAGFGITATKKIGNAVVRNKCKRRIRAALMQFLTSSNMVKTDFFNECDYVIIARNNTDHCDFQRLFNDMSFCFKNLNKHT